MTLTMITLSAMSAGYAAAQKCQGAKVKAGGKKASDKAKCHATAVKKGDPVDVACLTKAETKFTAAFAKAETNPPCATTGDAVSVEATVDSFIANLAAALGGPGPNLCTSIKYKEAGKKAFKKAGCHRKAILKGEPVDPACLAKVETKFLAGIAKADAKGPCTGTATAVEAIVDDFIADLLGKLSAPFARAKVITDGGELVGGPLARGMLGDLLIENDRIRVVVQKPGRVMFGIGTYGGNIIDADLRRFSGSERDSFEELATLINVENTANYTNVIVLNDGSNGAAAVIRATGPDDLLDFINPSSVVADFGFPFPTDQDDRDLPVDVQTDYILDPTLPYVKIETTLTNTDTLQPLQLFFGDIMNGSGELELFEPAYGFGEPLVTDTCAATTFEPCTAGSCDLCDFIGWGGIGAASGVSYGYIHATNSSSNFNTSGVSVSLLGRRVVFVLIGAQQENFTILPSGTLTLTRYFAIGDGSVGAIADIRNTIRGVSNTGTISGVVTVAGSPVANADVVLLDTPFVGGPDKNVATHFHTAADGSYSGTVPAGNYQVRANKEGHLFGTPDPANVAITAGNTTVQNIDLPAPGHLSVNVTDENSDPIPAKVQLVGFDPSPDPLNQQVILGTISNTTGVFAPETGAVDGLAYGIAFVDFADKNGQIGTVDVEPGTYQLAVSHGTRYSASQQNVTITSGATTSVNVQIARVIDTPGFIAGDFHVHSLNSPDSEVTNEDRVATQLAEGMDFFTPSDHDIRVDFAPVIAAMGVGNLISTAQSAEITTFDYGHFNSWPVTFDPLQVNGGGVDWGRAGIAPGADFPSSFSYNLTPQEIWAAAASDPKPNLTQINHMGSHFNRGGLSIDTAEGTTGPPQSHTPGADRRLDPLVLNYYSSSFEALEVWIGTDGRGGALNAFIGENLGDWVNLINQGILPTGIADSDTHQKRQTQINARTYLASNVTDPGMLGGLEAENLAANAVAGKATGTNAPFVNITVTTVDGSAGLDVGDNTLVDSSDGNATVTLTVKSPLWAEFDRVQFLVNAKPEAVDDDSNVTTPPRYRALAGNACTVANGCYEVNEGDVNFVSSTVNPFPLIPGAERHEATVTLNLTGLTVDTSIIALVRGTDGISKPLFPFDPSDIHAKACSNNRCRACSVDADCTVPGTCTVTNQTLGELTDGNLNQCGVPTLAFTNPIYINANGVAGWQAPGVMLAP